MVESGLAGRIFPGNSTTKLEYRRETVPKTIRFSEQVSRPREATCAYLATQVLLAAATVTPVLMLMTLARTVSPALTKLAETNESRS